MAHNDKITDCETGTSTPVKDAILHALENHAPELTKDDITIIQLSGIPAEITNNHAESMKRLGLAFANNRNENTDQIQTQINFSKGLDDIIITALQEALKTITHCNASSSPSDITVHDTGYNHLKSSLNGQDLQPAINIAKMMADAFPPQAHRL